MQLRETQDASLVLGLVPLFTRTSLGMRPQQNTDSPLLQLRYRIYLSQIRAIVVGSRPMEQALSVGIEQQRGVDSFQALGERAWE